MRATPLSSDGENGSHMSPSVDPDNGAAHSETPLTPGFRDSRYERRSQSLTLNFGRMALLC